LSRNAELKLVLLYWAKGLMNVYLKVTNWVPPVNDAKRD
jgi:hypothetical protein